MHFKLFGGHGLRLYQGNIHPNLQSETYESKMVLEKLVTKTVKTHTKRIYWGLTKFCLTTTS